MRSRGLRMSSSEAQTRLLNFVCIEPFQRLWTKHGLTEDDMISLENEILTAPRKGVEVPGSGGFRKTAGVASDPTWERAVHTASYTSTCRLMRPCALSSCLARVTERT